MEAINLVDCKNTVGESCFWDVRDEHVYWTDIEQSKVYRLAPDGELSVFSLPERAGFIMPRQEAGFVIGFATRIALADADFKTFSTLKMIEEDLPQTRINDACVDPFGGIVFGTYDETNRQPVASVYRISPTAEITRLITEVTTSNGLAFSPYGELMYFADTQDQRIRRFRVGTDFSSFEEISILAGPDIAPGKPDGAAVDEEGYYWSARVRGSCLARISPDGELADVVDMPVDAPTKPAFAGDGRRLFVTSLSGGYSAEQWAKMPLAGGLFEVKVEVAGKPERLSLL